MEAMSLRKWNDRSEKKFVLIALLTPADSNVRAGGAHHHQDINSIRSTAQNVITVCRLRHAY